MWPEIWLATVAYMTDFSLCSKWATKSLQAYMGRLSDFTVVIKRDWSKQPDYFWMKQGYLKQQISVFSGPLRYLCDGEVPYVCMETGPETEKTKQRTKPICCECWFHLSSQATKKPANSGNEQNVSTRSPFHEYASSMLQCALSSGCKARSFNSQWMWQLLDVQKTARMKGSDWKLTECLYIYI